ncbi:CO or xanthine dehydrogenase, Mo-binding subunit [Caloramator quimbayensis]|uniref:CO or xanthine dehydrogenase, Mo-binding subunit n=1 Tax=Caloramator quimbayensis TaxID=1147123 RepID=A0A1T4Y7M5_9CLOT|nr:xanthine dehydrogenase family protein molybdopterin-binding subunit [Caloramator quimbayensis]SKA97720.1 CO or xanthine dehydrogenase, Mo-binding subunit [Caloramator quimbayensis]
MGRDIALSIRRDDAIAKISGEAKYTCDVKFENMLYGKTLRSKIARGKIKSIKYPSLPEGYYIVDKDDVPKPNKLKILKSDMSVFAQDVVNYVGEPIALVVGEDKEIIDNILSKIEVEYENIQPILTLEEGLNTKEPIYGDNNLFADYVVEKGDINEVKNRASYVYEGEYETGYQEQFYLETQGIIADFKDGKITIYGSMQCPYYIKNALLDFFKADSDKIRVVQLTTGGGFGGKEDYPSLIAAQAAAASIKCKRPVKIVYDRDEDIEFTTKRHPSKIKLKSYLDDNFKVIGMEADIILDGGAYASLSEVVLQRAMFAISGVYNIENLYVKGRAVATNKAISGAFRGFGAPQAFFAIEIHMEHIAKKFNLNPLDFKINNLIKRGDKSSTGGTFRDEIKLKEMIKRAEIMSSYNEKKSRFKEERKEGKLKGIGMSLFFHGGGFTGSGERDHIKAKVKLLKKIDETVEILISNVEMGQGAMTTSRKIVAYTLNIPIEKVIFENPDTDRVPDSGPTVASRTTVVVGELLREAAEELKNRWNENETLIVEADYKYPEGYEWDGDKFKGDAYTSYSFGVNVVEVEVDSITYESTIKNVYAVYDIGQAIDERIVKGQIDGGIVQGLGYAGIEVMENKEGRFLQRTSSDYIIPTSKDVPYIYSELLCEPFKYGPYGAKALGELTFVGSPPAYALSVEDALGLEISNIPVRPENILEVLRHGK